MRAVFGNLGPYALNAPAASHLVQNVMLVAGRDGPLDEDRMAVARDDVALAPLLARGLTTGETARLATRVPALSDEHGPAEWYAMNLRQSEKDNDSGHP